MTTEAATTNPATTQPGTPDAGAGTTPATPATPATPDAGASPAEVKLPVDPTPAVTPNPDTASAFAYEPTGDAGLDYALNFVGNLGYSDTHPAIIAAQSGDFSLIKAELATKGVAGSDQVLALAEQAYARQATEAKARDAELANFAHTAAGTAENWATVRAWAASEATPQEKAQINAALQQGGLVAQGVITQLVSMYSQKFTLPKSPAAAAKEGASSAASPAGEPMTAQAYAKAVEELRRKLGSKTDDSAEYADLQRQRLAARRAGL